MSAVLSDVHRLLIRSIVLTVLAPLFALADARPDPALNLRGANWIWFPEGNAAQDAPVTTRYFRLRFDLPTVPASARWMITVDDSHLAYVNGTEVAKSDHWPTADRVDVTKQLRTGTNVLAVAAFNGAGPGGLVAKLRLVDGDGKVREIATDKSWKAAKSEAAGWTSLDFDDATWPSAMEVASVGAAPWGAVGPAEPIVPDESFPRFIVPGQDAAMESLRNLYWHHYKNNGPMATLWDEWLPPATLWPATGDKLRMRERWAAVLTNRHIDADGYVSTHQHDGTGHAEGWPFPLWHQGAGIGWHFVGTGVGGYEPPLAKPDGWTLLGAKGGEIDKLGWNVEMAEPRATLQTPVFAVDVYHAPFLRLNWRASGLERAKPYIEWTTKDAPQFSADRRIYFAPAAMEGEKHLALLSGSQNTTLASQSAEVRTMFPVYKHPAWKGTIIRLRIGFDNPSPGAKVIIKSLHTAYDTRHNINNFNFIRGVASQFNWTGDVTFLRDNANRARIAMRYAMDEFQTRQRKLVFTPWVGHEGTSGVVIDANGKKSIQRGRGIGNNYWDLMPFGGEDALATIYYFDALRDWAGIEQAIADHPAWNIPRGALAFDANDLRTHADEVKAFAGQRFWNQKTGRFVAAIDRDGVAHDYGYTFMNTEAIYHGFATDEQAKSILSWVSGEHTVAGDTSTGADIYHFRFGPRSTTKRNTDYYFWGWSHPESILFGYQVQDGGAVLGWSYHDLMARVITRGPDDAWQRLHAIINWFDEVQSEGGYRAYYRDPSRGTMQGNNTAGGLGLDAEFVESVLVPNVMPYGFLGFEPKPDGFKLNPRLPDAWPSLEIRGIHFHDAILNIAVSRDEITITPTNQPAEPAVIELPPRFARLSYGTPIKLQKGVPLRSNQKE